MNFQRYENVDAFAKIVTPFLEENEDKFSLLLGVLKGIKAGAYENPYMATIEENGKLLAIFQMTPPHPLNIIFVDENQISTCIDLCISELTKHAVPVESIISVKEWAVLFGQKWQEKTDGNFSLMMDQGLYRLDQVEESLEMSPGKWRYAAISDAQLIEKWYSQFEQDTGLSVTAPKEIKKRVKNMLDGKEVFFWEDQGEVVSMMKKSRPTTNGITVSLVFTPAEKRKKGTDEHWLQQ